MEKKEFDEELIRRVENAAEKGARNGSKGKNFGVYFLPTIIALVIVLGGVFFIKHSLEKKWSNFSDEFMNQFAFDDPADSHDMVMDDNGLLGYTAADFAEAVLGDATQLKKVEVYEAKVSDAVTLTKTGLVKLKAFTKTQLITYNGKATYTVDLSKLSESDFALDEDEKKVVIHIPHVVCEKINIPSDEMEFGDTERGLLAFGEIKMTAEDYAKIETEAESKMNNKLVELKAEETADRFAKMTIWEMYQPIITAVSPEYKLEIVFNE